MTRHDFLVKWGAYALALLPVWLVEACLLPDIPALEVRPMLLPLAAAAVAVLEGAGGGAGFGLGAGLLWICASPGLEKWLALGLCLAGLGAGLLTQYVLRRDLLGCILCSGVVLAALDGARIVVRLFQGERGLEAMLRLSGRGDPLLPPVRDPHLRSVPLGVPAGAQADPLLSPGEKGAYGQ